MTGMPGETLDGQGLRESLAGLAAWFNARWEPRMGAIDGNDLSFIAGLIDALRPARFLEIGCASGFSTALVAALMDGRGGGRIDSIDFMRHFYADTTKPVGYLLDEAPPHPSVRVNLHLGKTALDAADLVDGMVDICFIDATHKHPWPTIDTLAVLPLVRPGGVIIEHDLQMMRNRTNQATGPKILFDQTPEALRIQQRDMPRLAREVGLRARTIADNLYALRVPEDKAALAAALSEGFYIRWEVGPRKRVDEGFAERYAAILRQTCPAALDAFLFGLDKHNAAPKISA